MPKGRTAPEMEAGMDLKIEILKLLLEQPHGMTSREIREKLRLRGRDISVHQLHSVLNYHSTRGGIKLVDIPEWRREDGFAKALYYHTMMPDITAGGNILPLVGLAIQAIKHMPVREYLGPKQGPDKPTTPLHKQLERHGTFVPVKFYKQFMNTHPNELGVYQSVRWTVS